MTNEIVRGFWKNLHKPIFVLAPMHDVTDAAFRNIIAKYGKPDVFYTEFASTEALMSEKGHDKVMHYLKFSEAEHPIVAQVFGSKSEKFYETTKLVASLGFDGIDINMGCPEKNAVRGGSCAGLFHTPEIAKDLILACKQGASEYAAEHGTAEIPVSIKIRIGDTKVDWENWIAKLLEAQPAAIAIHLRTRKEMSKVDAHWEEMPKIVKFINEHTTAENRPVILGNGDVQNLEQAQKLIDETNCDGVMLGRAIFGNPWLFSNRGDRTSAAAPSLEERLNVLLEHTKLYEEYFSGTKAFDVMKRHFKAYVAGFDGAAELRAQMFETKSASELESVINKFRNSHPETLA
ncbi:MAG TPA: tRNA-dihydrouridine synthase [Patescibacteria group bacterium]|jgi:nifR3 family TIM-barrel protein|nr:tRNA-dihydrouridine synthase [Patescibacteria group bacterium]